MSGQARNDWMKKQSAPENKEVIVVKTDTVSCSNNYCGRVFINE